MRILVVVYASISTRTHEYERLNKRNKGHVQYRVRALCLQYLCAHNIVASIDEHDLTGNGACIGTTQEKRRITHFALFDVSA